MRPSIPVVDLNGLGFDGGAHILVKLALADSDPGRFVGLRGTHPELQAEAAVWCRQMGHRLETVDHDPDGVVAVVERGPSSAARWSGADRAGDIDGGLVDNPPAGWGLAPRGAMVEPGGPAPAFALSARDEVWSERAGQLYAQAAATQWDPWSAIDWNAPIDHDGHIETAVVQVMTFLVENEEAALVVPARFLGQIHPHFREIQQVLAVTVADEARHIEVFTRRAGCTGRPLALSSAGGRESLQTLLEEPDYATASFLLSVMGEGSFLSLLSFLERHAPDGLTRQISHLTRQDEARHVAFAMSHLERHASRETDLRPRLARAVERRHHQLRDTAGLNDEVFDALVVLAAGDSTPSGIQRGWSAVQALQRDMDESRRARLSRLGFSTAEADTLSALHTRNFM